MTPTGLSEGAQVTQETDPSPVVSQRHPHSCHQRVVAAFSEHQATAPTKAVSLAWPSSRLPSLPPELSAQPGCLETNHVILCVWEGGTGPQGGWQESGVGLGGVGGEH